MYDIRKLHSFKHLLSFGFVLLGLCHSVSVSAQWAYTPSDNGVIRVLSGRGWPGGLPSGAVPVSSTAPVGAAVTTGGVGISTNGGPNIAVAGRSPVPVSKAAPVVIDVVAKVPPRSAAVMIGKALKLVPVLATGYALYDLAKELGYDVQKNGADVAVSSAGPSSAALTCSAAFPQYPARIWHTSGYSFTFADDNNPTPAGWVWVDNCTQGPSNSCYGVCTRSGSLVRSPTTTPSAPLNPSTLQALEDSIALKSGWPIASNVSKAVRDASEATGEPVPIEGPPTVTGPATSPGGTTTTQNGDGTKSVATTTNNHNYAGDTINTTTVTTTNNYDTSNQVINTTTTTTTPPAPDKASDCEKNPDSNGCRTDEFDTPDGDVPTSTKNITFAAENLGFAGGSCPADKVLTFHGVASPVKVFNWVDTCDKVTTYAKPMILALATFAALMIIFAGVKPE